MKVNHRGFEIAYNSVGHGTPVVLLPGLFMSQARWSEVGVVDQLAGKHRVVAIDPLGFGGSSTPHDSNEYSSSIVAAGIVAVLDELGLDRSHFWGYSMGAALAVDLAALHPDRVMSLVLGGNPVLPRSALPENTALVSALRSGDWPRAWEAFGIPLPEATRRLMEERNDPVAQAAFLEGVRDDVDVEALDCPKLFYVGGGEWFWEAVRDVADRAGGQFELIGDLGHAATFQAPELVLPAVEAFLEEHDG